MQLLEEGEVEEEPATGHAGLTDQEYLVSRAREAASQGEEWAAKTWMVTAKSLFPDNFGIQFEAYTTVKEGGQARESAAFLQDLFTKFPGEARIAGEIVAVMEVLKAGEGEEAGEGGFYATMFDHVGEASQRKMVVQAAEQAKDPLEHCRLMLILLRRFPDKVAQHGEKLVESINTAERLELGASPNPLNVFRRMLVVEVLLPFPCPPPLPPPPGGVHPLLPLPLLLHPLIHLHLLPRCSPRCCGRRAGRGSGRSWC